MSSASPASPASPAMEPSPALLGATLTAEDGRRVPFGDRVGGCPVLVLFLREAGCIACAEQVYDLAPRLPELAALGVRVVLIGNGAPENMSTFLTRHGLTDKPVEVYTDPTLASYRAAALARSAWATHGPFALVDFVRALTRGHRPGPIDGNLRQQGGALLFDDAGRIVWSHRNTSLGDHPDPSDVVDAVLATLLARSPVPI